jgi:hypothetical protein
MEILNSWLVQDWVFHTPAETVFKNTDVASQLPSVDPVRTRQTLNAMRCVKKQPSGGVVLMVHNELPGDQVCTNCDFEASGSSGCVIARADVRKVFESRKSKLSSV